MKKSILVILALLGSSQAFASTNLVDETIARSKTKEHTISCTIRSDDKKVKISTSFIPETILDKVNAYVDEKGSLPVGASERAELNGIKFPESQLDFASKNINSMMPEILVSMRASAGHNSRMGEIPYYDISVYYNGAIDLDGVLSIVQPSLSFRMGTTFTVDCLLSETKAKGK